MGGFLLKDSHTPDLAGIAGLEPAMQESKSCALTDLAISQYLDIDA